MFDTLLVLSILSVDKNGINTHFPSCSVIYAQQLRIYVVEGGGGQWAMVPLWPKLVDWLIIVLTRTIFPGRQ